MHWLKREMDDRDMLLVITAREGRRWGSALFVQSPCFGTILQSGVSDKDDI